MRVRAKSIVTFVVLCWGVLPLAGALAAETGSPDQAQQIQALQKQVEALTQELAKVQSAPNPQAQQQAMQSHWGMMQNHMQSMRQWPGMNPTGCSDWMMMDPSMMGSGMMGGGMMGGCWDHGTGMMGHGMMGGGMMGQGMGWALPNETPAQYQKRMQTLQQDMRKQMAAIAAETDPTKRDALIRQHYETMYRNMQTMRGMGWMWNQGTASALPDANSPGATLESKYCSQCHAAPPPDVHTAKEWADVTGRMQQHIGDQATTNGGVMVPSASEMTSIVEYLDKHAKAGG